MSETNLSAFIWSVADLLRGDYKQSEYGKVILPFTVLRRLDCVLEDTKARVLVEKEKREKAGLNPEPFLLRTSGQHFFNTSPLDLKKLMGDQDNIGENLRAYVQAFSAPVRDIFEPPLVRDTFSLVRDASRPAPTSRKPVFLSRTAPVPSRRLAFLSRTAAVVRRPSTRRCRKTSGCC